MGTVYNSYASKTELINDVVGLFWQRAFAETMKTLAAPHGAPLRNDQDDASRNTQGNAGVHEAENAAPADDTIVSAGKTSIAEDQQDFISFCEELSQSLRSALKQFRKDFLSDLSALSEGDHLSAQKREQQSFIHARAGIKQVLLADSRIKHEQLIGALAPDNLAALVWETLIDSARDDMSYDETLFALLRTALY